MSLDNFAPAASGREAIGHAVKAVNRCRARIRFKQRIEHPQRSRLAGAVRPEQSGDAAVFRGECDAVDCFDLAERLVQVLDRNHKLGTEAIMALDRRS